MVTNDEFYETKFDAHKLIIEGKTEDMAREKYLDEEDGIYVNGFLMLPVEIINHMDNSIYSLKEL